MTPYSSPTSEGGGGSHAETHETGGADKVHFAHLERNDADVTLHDALTSAPHISQADKDRIHDRLHALDSALDHSGTITDTQHGSRGSGLHADSHPFYVIVPILTANQAWTNMPAAETEIFGQVRNRHKVVLTKATEMRIVLSVTAVGYSGANLSVEYSTDDTTYIDINALTVLIDSLGRKATAWTAIVDGAKADIWLKVLGAGGDGVADPAFAAFTLQFR